MSRAWVVLVALILVQPPGWAKGRKSASRSVTAAKVAQPQLKRELKKRVLRIHDDTGVSEVHVAGGIPTSLSFLLDVEAERLLLADPKERFFDPQTNGRTVVLVPKEDLPAGERAVLQVTLADGTLLPFTLSTVPAEADLMLEVELELKRRAGPESVAALKSSVADIQGRLDECQASAGEQGMAKVAALVLAQDPSKPEAFTVEKHPARRLDKQSRLLLETRHIYRLFDLSYLVLTVENRDPSRAWVLERAEVSVAGGAQSTETRVVAVAEEVKVLAPGETARLVVGFATPSQEVSQRYALKLYEKGGPRHVELSF
jgi:uncharacterized protein (TIGR02268 family)